MPVNIKFVVLFLTKLKSVDAEISLDADSNNISISQTDS
ncbi:hypothetical protein D083_0837 [Dickeya solani RNS 08.23.3.1.A]|nr:hypothetical protein D083_0837 [Dickeya solani RNS 08.23.3.1.A]